MCLDCEFLSVTKNIHFWHLAETCNDVITSAMYDKCDNRLMHDEPCEAQGTPFSRNHAHTGNVKLLLRFR